MHLWDEAEEAQAAIEAQLVMWEQASSAFEQDAAIHGVRTKDSSMAVPGGHQDVLTAATPMRQRPGSALSNKRISKGSGSQGQLMLGELAAGGLPPPPVA